MYNTGHRTITATWYNVQFCHMSSPVCLWGNLLSWLMFRNGQQQDTCGLGGWLNQLFGHFYLKGYPHIMDVPGYGISSTWKLCTPWWTIMLICKPELFLATLKIQVCLLLFYLPSNHLLLTFSVRAFKSDFVFAVRTHQPFKCTALMFEA
jgi:hypothetical protein